MNCISSYFQRYFVESRFVFFQWWTITFLLQAKTIHRYFVLSRTGFTNSSPYTRRVQGSPTFITKYYWGDINFQVILCPTRLSLWCSIKSDFIPDFSVICLHSELKFQIVSCCSNHIS